MERRLLLAIVLVFIVLTAYQWLVPMAQPVAPAPASQATAPGVTASAPTNPAAAEAAPTPASPALPADAAPAAEVVVGDAAERTVTVENGVVRAVFSNRGATLVAWELLRYLGPDGKPVDLVPRDVPASQPKPFSLRLDDAAKTARVNSAFFMTQSTGSLNAGSAPVTLSFEYQEAAGLHARKQFVFKPNSYDVTLTVDLTEGEHRLNPFVQSGPGLGDVLASGGRTMFRNVRNSAALFSIGGDVERIQAANLAKTPRYQGNYEFAGVDTHYFMSTAVKPGGSELEYHPLSIPSTAAGASVSRDYVGYDIRPQAAPDGPATVRFFVGPKHFETLRQADADLVRAIWFGMFSFLSVPLLAALNWINGFVGNYGWSILVLTVLINAVMFPLRHKSFVSMRKMQEIQPQVKMVQDRYAKLKMSDPARQKMNTELMDLYRAKGVNPASGCVPMLLTFPVLLAFYGLLSEAVELRGAPFMLWIHDLSVADPYYVTPILMGLSQMAQQRMAPAQMDPAQQKMMMIMPVVFTFLFITSPSGLALYWLASNVLLIGQQVLTNYIIGPPDIRVPRTPAERRLKKVGEGKTDAAAESPEPMEKQP